MMRKGRRRRHKRDQGSVQLNLAAMLDMAFQLLTFFILTFRPAPIEGQLALNLPPPVAQTKIEAGDKAGDAIGDVLSADTLHLGVKSDSHGNVRAIHVALDTNPIVEGQLDSENMHRLEKKLQGVFDATKIAYDRVQIAVDGKLHYGELMKIIDVCHRQHLPDGTQMQKISFTESDFGSASSSK